MGSEESGLATIVSNNSSRESFAGLTDGNDGISWKNSGDLSDAEQAQQHQLNNTTSSMSNKSDSVDQPPERMNAVANPLQHINAARASTSVGVTAAMAQQAFPGSLIVAKSQLPILPSAGIAMPAAPANNTVPEFLYQLTKMLTGGHNEIIEWSNGRIEVHNPHKLESLILQKYFRHSKFASFQRQLNYFGFRKLAGKGKMAPCSYVNDAATQDIGSLLLIKRKASATPRDKEKGSRKQVAGERGGGKAVHAPLPTSNGNTAPLPAPIVYKQSNGVNNASAVPVSNTQQAIEQAAVGRGIRHSLVGFAPTAIATASTAPTGPIGQAVDGSTKKTKFPIPVGVEDSLSQLANNYKNSLVEHSQQIERTAPSELERAEPVPDATSSYVNGDPYPSLLSRNSSLIDLAMIPTLEDGPEGDVPTIPGMSFVDFPQPEVDPSNTAYQSYLASGSQQEEEPNP